MARKKIVFVIVEGPSDDEALGVLLTRIFGMNTVYVHVMHGDITTRNGVNSGNVVSKIVEAIKDYAENKFKSKDFCRVIHIADMDGAFIPDENIVEDSSKEKPFYLTTEIRTRDKVGIEERNRQKRENLNRLSITSSVWNIPYQIYYMSCNLDHVLHDKLNSTDDEKEEDAYAFVEKYKDDIQGFLKFISESDFSVTDGYIESWKYIKEELHSLERHTNLGLCFDT